MVRECWLHFAFEGVHLSDMQNLCTQTHGLHLYQFSGLVES